MFFNRLVVIWFAIALSGCGLKVGEKPAEVKPISVGKVGFGCMSNISKTIRSYVLAEMNASQVTQFFDCLKYSFVSFGNYIKFEQKDRNIYAATEIRDFLQKYFVRDRVITDELLREFMNLKKVMVGGSVERVTKAELMRGVEVLEELKEEALKLNRFMPVLNSFVGIKNRAEGVPLPSTTEAIRALKDAAERIGEIMATSHQSYSLKSLERFLSAFRDFVQWDQQFLRAKSPQKWTDFFKVFKAITVRPPRDLIEPQEWPRLMSALAGWYAIYLRYLFELEERPVFYGKGLSEANAMFQDAIELLSKSIEAQPRKVIEFEYLDDLFDVLGELEILPANIKPASLKAISRPLIQKIFGDLSLPPEKRTARGVTLITLRQIQTEFERWHSIQWNLDQLFVPNAEFQETVSARTELRKNFNEVSPELNRIWDKVRPLFRDNEYRVFLAEDDKLKQYGVMQNFHNLSMMNLMRTGISFVLRGYAQDVRRFARMEGITEDELQSFYLDFRPLGIDLKFMDPNNFKVGHRAFIEANLFTYGGNGVQPVNTKKPLDHLFTYEEGIEYLSLLTSGALMAHELRRDLRTVCADYGVDVYGDPAISRECFKQNLRAKLVPKLWNMPEMQKFLIGASDEVWDKFAEAMMKASLKPLFDQEGKALERGDIVEIGDISSFCVILHYVEVAMTRFDLDKDGFLTNNKNANEALGYEIDKAFPIFNQKIKDIGKIKKCREISDWESRGAFGYILTYKEMPETFESSVNIVWSRTIDDWSYQLNRLDLAQVFATIMDGIKPKESKNGAVDGAAQCK